MGAKPCVTRGLPYVLDSVRLAVLRSALEGDPYRRGERVSRRVDDEYVLLEACCTDPACDCRRVMLNVASRRGAE